MIICFDNNSFDDEITVKKKLNLFLMSYETGEKDVIQIFNDFTSMTKARVHPQLVPDILRLINNLRNEEIDHLIIFAEADKLIPCFRGKLKRLKRLEDENEG